MSIPAWRFVAGCHATLIVEAGVVRELPPQPRLIPDGDSRPSSPYEGMTVRFCVRPYLHEGEHRWHKGKGFRLRRRPVRLGEGTRR